MAYVSKEFKAKILQYFRDYDYSYRNWLRCYYNLDMHGSKYYMNCQRRYYAMYEFFYKLLETL